MDLGISTWLFGRDELTSEYLTLIKEAGIDKIEIMGAVPSHFRYDNYKQVTLVSKIVRSLGMQVVSMHSPFGVEWDLSSFDRDNISWTITETKKVIDALQLLGGKILVVHTPCLARVRSIEAYTKLFKSIRGDMSKILEYCGKKKIIFATENCNQYILRFLDDLGTECSGLVIDTGHEHEAHKNLADLVYQSGKKLVHLHVSDALTLSENFLANINDYKKRAIDWEYTVAVLKERGTIPHIPPYEGEIKWKEFVMSLKDIDYKGVFMFEIRPAQSRQYRVENLKKVVKGFTRMMMSHC